MLLRLLAINHNNAREKRRVNFFSFFALFCKTGFVVDTYHPQILTIALPSPETCSRQGLAPFFPSAAAVWSGWGQLWHATTSRGHTPPPRSLKTSRKEQEFDPATASDTHCCKEGSRSA